jgi:peptidoglycan hydrolase CwlO-like protein
MLKPKLTKIIFHKLTAVAVGVSIIALTIGGVIRVPFAQADQYDQAINQIRVQNNGARSAQAGLNAQARDLNEVIGRLQAQINDLQKNISDNQAKEAAIKQQIIDAETELAKQKKLLGENIKAMYIEGDMSTLEMLALSNDISEYVDKQQYRNSVKDKITDTLDTITALKLELARQKSELEVLIKSLQDQQAQVDEQRGEQSRLLSLNRDQAAEYESQIRANNAQITELRRQQEEAFRRIMGANGTSQTGSSVQYKNLSGYSVCGGGYPYCNVPLDAWVTDPWGLHLARECVHYVAWALANKANVYVPSFPPGRGSAYQWEGSLSGVARVDNNPSGAEAVYMPIGSVGHVGYIEENYGDGWVRISQYNFGVSGAYSTMDLKVTSNLRFFHFN